MTFPTNSLIATIATVLFAGSFAQADGFRCLTDDGTVAVKVYNHTSPEDGTRNGAVMVVSDPSIQHGRKTIATFRSIDGRLTSSNVIYTANVDLRYNESGRAGENIGGTKLGELDEIRLSVLFSYSNPVAYGEEVPARLALIKRNGDTVRLPATCQRYLKGE